MNEYSNIPDEIRNKITKSELKRKIYKLTEDENETPFAIIYQKGKQWPITKKGNQWLGKESWKNLLNKDKSDQISIQTIIDVFYDKILDGVNEIKKDYPEELTYLQKENKNIFNLLFIKLKLITI